ncbi:Serine/threonine-protein kinase-like protein At1g28390 [Linum perenne]
MGYLPCNADSAIAVCGTLNHSRHRRKPFSTVRHFTYSELSTATGAFSPHNFLGKGSQGAVYRATLDGGKLIAAVKQTIQIQPHNHALTNFRNNSVDATTPGENEIEILSKVRHPRLVNLIGFCADSSQRKLIVVDYMPNGSLYDQLHSGSVSVLGWTRRVRFALQVAKAVQALHSSDPPVIHRDIKSSNVLIDAGFNARLGDFGLALMGHVEDVRVKCTPPAGTLGYLDPGYLAPGDLSSKSDVFSFGILLLEIISGRKAIDVNFSPPSVVDWAVPIIKRCEFDSVVDGRIGVPADRSVVRSLAILAARCVRSAAEKRPEMTDVVEGLKAVRKRVEVPAIWIELRRRFGCVEQSDPVVAESEEAVVGLMNNRKMARVISRRNRKVSSVSITDKGSGESRKAESIVKSRSTGSFREIQIGAAEYYKLNDNYGVGKAIEDNCDGGNGVRIEARAIKLSKSRSTGVLNRRVIGRSNSHRCRSRGYAIGDSRRDIEVSMSKLQISFDEDCEEKMQEKPLFSITASN